MVVQVSIIIPTFNRSYLLEETLTSVFEQTFQCWECIIVDDHSTDRTVETANFFVEKDQRFKFFKRPLDYPRGASNCRNYGYSLSCGKYIQWLDDDDLLSRTKLEMQLMALNTVSDSRALITCDWDLWWTGKSIQYRNIVGENKFLSTTDFFNELRKQQTFVPVHSFLIPRVVIDHAGLWNNQLSMNDDAEFIARVMLHSGKLISVPNCYVLYRSHEGERLSRQNSGEKLESLLLSLKLIHAYLKRAGIENRRFFKWKLLKILLREWGVNSDELKKHRYFFLENGIGLNAAKYYVIKNNIYKKVHPFIKRVMQ